LPCCSATCSPGLCPCTSGVRHQRDGTTSMIGRNIMRRSTYPSFA
jgi:hypothetical protein